MDNLPGSHDCLGKSWDQAMAANGDHSTEKQWKHHVYVTRNYCVHLQVFKNVILILIVLSF